MTTKKTRLRAVVYARVSSGKQRDQKTIDSQLHEVPKYITSQGWVLAAAAETYVDDGKTAKAGHLDARRGFQRLLSDAEEGLFDVVVAVDDDRFTRSEDLLERLEIYGRFKRAGVKLAFSDSGQIIDTSSSTDELLAMIGGWVSAQENAKRRDRIVRGKQKAIRNNKKPAGPTPFGLLYDRELGEFRFDDAVVSLVREIYDRVESGTPCSQIAADFDVRGIPTGSPNVKTRRNSAKRWTRERVWKIATNAVYRGQWVVDKKRNQSIVVPSIVSDQQWHAAQGRLASWNRRGLDRTKHVYLCQKIAVCSICGAKIGISTHSDKRKRRGYYVCTRRRRPDPGAARCTLPMRRIEDVDARVWAAVTQLLSTPEQVERALERQRRQAGEDGRDWLGDIKGYERRLTQSTTAEASILARFSAGRISEAAMDKYLVAAAKEQAMLRRQIETAERGHASSTAVVSDMTAVLATVETLRSRLTDATKEVRRDIVGALVPGVGDRVIILGPSSIELGVSVAAPRVAHASLSG